MAVLEYNDVKAFFLKAMKYHPFVNGIPAEQSETHPGFETFVYEDEAFKLVDTWYPGKHSYGYTIIWHNGKPAWMMSYNGTYPPSVFATLRGALKSAYFKEKFFGGRGEFVYKNGVFTYINTVTAPNDFMSGHGEETIYDTAATEIIGFHKYSYRALGN